MNITAPVEAQPLDVVFDRLNEFDVFFCRVSIVKTQIALTLVVLRNAEIQADRLRMADMQIAIRLRRETGVNGIVFPGRQIFINNLTDKICWAGFSLTHCAIPLRNIDSTDNRLCSNKPRRETTVSCIKSWLSLYGLSENNKKREEIALFPF